MIEQGLNCFRSPLPHSPLASVQTRSRLRIPVPHDVLHPDQELHLLRACAVSDKKIGGTVAKWSKALQLWEKINENQKIPGSSPDLGNLLSDKKITVKDIARDL